MCPYQQKSDWDPKTKTGLSDRLCVAPNPNPSPGPPNPNVTPTPTPTLTPALTLTLTLTLALSVTRCVGRAEAIKVNPLKFNVRALKSYYNRMDIKHALVSGQG